MEQIRYIIHDLAYNTYYTGKGETGFSNYKSSAYLFKSSQEALSALHALKRSNPRGNKGCIYEKVYVDIPWGS